MKNKTFSPGCKILVMAAVAIMTQSCRKAVEYIRAHEDGRDDCRGCNIKQVTVNTADELSNDTVVFTFTYNAFGDPLTVKNTQVATGNPNMVFKYDKFGRMVELVRPYSNFSYDAGGNLVSPGTVYDSHLSILRTNRIWMFLCNNYSLNNGFQASTYNGHGLPLRFEGSYSAMQIIVPFSGQFVVQYGCH